MIIILPAIVGLVIAIFGIVMSNYYREKSQKDKIIKQNQEIENKKREREKIREELLNSTVKVFEDIGWSEWDASIHRAEGQLDRIQRSLIPDEYRLFCYNPKTGISKILSKSGKYYLTNGHRCSCPDFRERGLPCKHMYFLAYVTPDYKELFPDLKKGNSLKGLNFCICGRGQADVKEYITAHGGEIGNIFIRETSAIVLASEIESSVVATAREHNMEILSFEQLKTLFSD